MKKLNDLIDFKELIYSFIENLFLKYLLKYILNNK